MTDVGPVIVSASFPDRGGGRFVVSESRAGSGGKVVEVFACRELLRDLCRGFVPMCGPGGSIQSPATLSQSVRALRHLARTVDEKAGGEASSLRLADFSIEHLAAMESRLLRDHPGKRTASATSRCVARLLVAIEDEWPGRVPEAVRTRIRFSALPVPPCSPREPFSAFVADQLRRVCLAEMKEVAARIREGVALLEKGVDPETGGWDTVPNLLWAIDASRGAPILAKMRWKDRHSLPEPFNDTVSRLYPNMQDLLPFLVMLALQSGLPIECVTSLRRDCLRNPVGGTVQIDHVKWRAGSSPFRSKRYPDRGLRTPGGIVRALLEVTERAACHSGSPWLFVGDSQRRLVRMLFHDQTKHVFVERHHLVDDGGCAAGVASQSTAQDPHGGVGPRGQG